VPAGSTSGRGQTTREETRARAAGHHPCAAATRVLPMQLRIGDRFTDEGSEWEAAIRPWTTRGGKMVHATVQKPGDPRHKAGKDLGRS
jgi:hypothetical protein